MKNDVRISQVRLATIRKSEWSHCVKTDQPWDFPGGPVVKNLPYNAEDAGSIPGQGTKIPHAVRQLHPRATTTELVCLN